ncbi:MAG: hypothetical protein RBS46_09125 [Methyloversatilis sp.]|jgi:hypothetical protein|nr:hypothetical protein [Methyloversatilis sp.]
MTMWGMGEADVLAGALGGMRLLLCVLPGAVLSAWVACRFFGRRPLAMGLLSLAMVMLLISAWLSFGRLFQAGLSGALLLWFPIAAGASWLVAPAAQPAGPRAWQALLQGFVALVPAALTIPACATSF